MAFKIDGEDCEPHVNVGGKHAHDNVKEGPQNIELPVVPYDNIL